MCGVSTDGTLMSRVIEVDDDLQATLAVIRVLDDLHVPYVIGGSLASSTHGIARSTRDADLMADLRGHHVAPFIAVLQREFYVSEEAVREAIVHRRSFNLIHLQSGFKVDMFVKPESAFAQSQFDRRKPQSVFADPTPQVFVLSPEDILLNKLVWYKEGGGVSDRQWNDILGVLKVQGKRLDLVYLKHWAAELGVTELLERVLHDGLQK